MKKKISISKSSFIKGKQCLKALYLSKHFPELRDDISEGQQAIFDTGHKVGELAQQLFPGGTLTVANLYENYSEGIQNTGKLIHQGCEIIYEAGFRHENLSCFVDILVNEHGKWHIYEVKSSTEVKEVYVYDAAFQNNLLRKCGLDIGDVSIIYLNNKYCRIGEINLRELFSIESVFDRILKIQPEIRDLLSEQFKTLNKPELPDIEPGPHCSEPYDCNYMDTCWEEVPEYSVLDISKLKKKKKWELYNKGIYFTTDVPDDYPLNSNQLLQIQADKTGKGNINKREIRKFLQQLQYPLYFLDFETFNPAIPLFDQSSPYQQIVFQYSLHILDKPGGTLQHREYLAQLRGDPRVGMIEKLKDETGSSGNIIVYHKAFEKGRLEEIARDFPEYEIPIKNMISRMVDLMVPFQKKHYYVPEMRGSYSIKSVLPALVPGFSYDDLEINNGGLASNAFKNLLDETEEKAILETRENLLEYCKLDTLAMVEILKVLYRETDE